MKKIVKFNLLLVFITVIVSFLHFFFNIEKTKEELSEIRVDSYHLSEEFSKQPSVLKELEKAYGHPVGTFVDTDAKEDLQKTEELRNTIEVNEKKSKNTVNA